ncbi:putative nucleotidyltransferase with HDIG domain [Duganella sp. SG902]|uniref:HDOD domain-containing protein n=1 Tax=Duganella sp. SG902 TaxID=2587016 RepID=UPI00159E19F6|nr:HDOD domain-containing protein [Duganella sp. SG902]NVM79233.1 putative nucleotidyltransferase with HDIG domain [Duganella sp. SG902]
MTADDIIKAVRDLPSLPAVVSELLASIDQEDLDTHALASKITLDQALTAKTLRLANSSFYGMPSKVNTIHQAVAVLGFHSIRTLVTACAVTGSFPAAPASGLDFPAFWRHAVASAVCARVLAPYCRISPDTAFTAGLLHDLGTLVLATRFPTQYRLVIEHQRQHDCLSVTSQRAVFGVDHAAVGAALAAHWKFPAAIQAAVAEHHQDPPATAPGTQLPLTTLIHLANALAHALDLAGREDDQAPPLSLAAWQALDLSAVACARVFHDTEQMYNDMCQMLPP